MTSKEFVLWLKGFTDGVHEYNITPKQWDLLKEKLEQVSDEPKIGTPIGNGWGVPNTAPIMPLPYYPNPLDNPFKVTCITGSFGTTCSTGSFGTSGYSHVITTTPGYGSISINNPNTSYTHYNPESGSWHYTNTNYINPYKPFSTQTDDDLKSKKTKKK